MAWTITVYWPSDKYACFFPLMTAKRHNEGIMMIISWRFCAINWHRRGHNWFHNLLPKRLISIHTDLCLLWRNLSRKEHSLCKISFVCSCSSTLFSLHKVTLNLIIVSPQSSFSLFKFLTSTKTSPQVGNCIGLWALLSVTSVLWAFNNWLHPNKKPNSGLQVWISDFTWKQLFPFSIYFCKHLHVNE